MLVDQQSGYISISEIVFPLQIGKDKLGNCYWFQVDPEANVRVYREDLDDETWELVASNRFVFRLMDDLVKILLISCFDEGTSYQSTCPCSFLFHRKSS